MGYVMLVLQKWFKLAETNLLTEKYVEVHGTSQLLHGQVNFCFYLSAGQVDNMNNFEPYFLIIKSQKSLIINVNIWNFVAAASKWDC